VPARCRVGDVNKRMLTFHKRLSYPAARKECYFVCLMDMVGKKWQYLLRRILRRYL
jgi:hypothetical protein